MQTFTVLSLVEIHPQYVTKKKILNRLSNYKPSLNSTFKQDKTFLCIEHILKLLIYSKK